MKIELKSNIMDKNNAYAEKNRHLLAEKKILTLNIMGSPGGGKTTFLERLLGKLAGKIKVAVIEGDLATARDAERIDATGAAVVQINTGGGCHLDAKMISQVLPGFDLDDTDLLIIENVGNLVCPAGFDLGEDIRIVLMSVTEGNDKPAKYPASFLAADWVIINKTDLLPFTDFDLELAKRDIQEIKPDIRIFTSCCREQFLTGIDDISSHLLQEISRKKAAR
jgi:hydrogenase nickel incorporation protein HypB